MKTLKYHFNKIVLTTFYLLMLVYSQSGYAVIEDTTYKDELTGIEYAGIKVSEMAITLETAREITYRLVNHEHPIEYLCFEGVTFESGAAAIITYALRANPILRVFALRNNRYPDEDNKRMMFEVLYAMEQLTFCDVTDGVSDRYMPIIADIINKNKNLTKVYLVNNELTNIGALMLAGVLRINRSLKELNIVGNDIGDEGVIAIAQALEENKTLINFYITYNEMITWYGAKAIIEAIVKYNTTLLGIAVGNNIKLRPFNRSLEYIEQFIEERNELIGQISEDVRELIRRIEITALLGNHPRVGQDSPLSLVDVNILREIVTYYHGYEHENELDTIINFTNAQLAVLNPEVRAVIVRIRELHHDIVEHIRVLAEPTPPIIEMEQLENATIAPTPPMEIPRQEDASQGFPRVLSMPNYVS